MGLRRRYLWIVGTIVGCLVVLILIFLGYWFSWTWTGFGTVSSEPKQHAKTLWDWLQLLAAWLIPVVIAVFSFRYGRQQSQTENAIARDNQQEGALQAYIDKMSELLLEKKLRETKPSDEVRNIARARTLTVLPRLDQERKRSVLGFLHEAKLIDKSECIVNLDGADLREAHLHGACLIGSELSGVDFTGANLSGVRLEEANLYGANLTNAVLSLTMNKTESDADLWESVLAMGDRYSIQDPLNAAFLCGYYEGSAERSKTNLRNANLCMSILTAADLRGVDFCKAHLHYALLVKANLQRAFLQGASLIEAVLVEANLQEADLSGANLSKAILYGADLAGANLSGAVLTEANVTKEQLDKAKSLQNAIMPDGSKHS